MNNFDKGRVYAVPVLPAASIASSRGSNASNVNFTNTNTIAQLGSFLTTFRVGESFIYRDRLRVNLLSGNFTLEVELLDLINYDEELASRLRAEPSEVVPLVRVFFSPSSDLCSILSFRDSRLTGFTIV